MSGCGHRDLVEVPALTEAEKAGAVCSACVAMAGTWVHLRQCRTCGAVSCCDDSPNHHARAHAEGERHPVITSAQPDEHWSWCYVDEVVLGI